MGLQLPASGRAQRRQGTAVTLLAPLGDRRRVSPYRRGNAPMPARSAASYSACSNPGTRIGSCRCPPPACLCSQPPSDEFINEVRRRLPLIGLCSGLRPCGPWLHAMRSAALLRLTTGDAEFDALGGGALAVETRSGYAEPRAR